MDRNTSPSGSSIGPDRSHPPSIYSDPSKRHVINRACDICRRRKVRCDGAQAADGRSCAYCLKHNIECTYNQMAPVRRGPSKAYVTHLETKIEKLKEMLEQACPTLDIDAELEAEIANARGRRTSSQSAKHSPALPPSPPSSITNLHVDNVSSKSARLFREPGSAGSLPRSPIVTLVNSPPPSHQSPTSQPSPEDNGSEEFDLTNDVFARYHGESSEVVFTMAASELKPSSSPRMFKINRSGITCPGPIPKRRPQFWTKNKWEQAGAEYFDWKEILHLPPPDLFESLVDLFFTHVSPQIPIIHEPTLRAQILSGLHTRDYSFARLMLAICALGARWSKDARVLHESEREAVEAGKPDAPRLSAGLKYFNQIRLLRRSMPKPAVLFDIQTYVFCAILVHSSFEPHNAWIIIGLGLRSAQDVGMHRRRVPPPGESLSIEDEMKKRAFWALLFLDRTTGLQMGRPSAIQDVDLDLDPVVDFPESSWPADSKANPAGLSSAAYMNAWIRLAQIAGFALQTIFALNKSKIRLGFGSAEWEAHLVMQIDSDLNAWLENIPPELRWNPTQPSTTLLSQSAMLYAGFYNLQICVHRPFIISRSGPTSSLYQPSVAIVTSASRMVSQILDGVRRREIMPGTSLISSAFSAGVCLLISIWGNKKLGTAEVEGQRELHSCMKFLRYAEQYVLLAGRLWDILVDMSTQGQLPLPPTDTLPTPPQSDLLVDHATLPQAQAAFRDSLWDTMGADAMQFNSFPFLTSDNNSMMDTSMDTMLAAETFVTGDMVDMWSTAPQTFEWNEWDNMMSSVSALGNANDLNALSINERR
ncbi:putative transcriptional regulatory protein C3C7,04 OS=Schizosaccharomyces pombe (strain 972 / ATCC 24843) GN=SPAC3C7.04 PE=3 SV=1 [Rhizoctonia solani AG-1 IB]|nr:putative transcriptional regulatory protein C3C7,04 OS=Schizosaccharomyces pombe (strain 972 / ATCC 24843) GN=SPAC3C7.04 PE=3 SV=1 [Rhizoctonia solani AG-1 IB]